MKKKKSEFPLILSEHKTPRCPKCGSTAIDHELRNFDRMWGDGEVFCIICNTKVRNVDSG